MSLKRLFYIIWVGMRISFPLISLKETTSVRFAVWCKYKAKIPQLGEIIAKSNEFSFNEHSDVDTSGSKYTEIKIHWMQTDAFVVKSNCFLNNIWVFPAWNVKMCCSTSFYMYIKAIKDTCLEVQEIYWNGLYRHFPPFVW